MIMDDLSTIKGTEHEESIEISEFGNEIIEQLGFAMFSKINESKFGKHSIIEIHTSKDKRIFAGRCNCGVEMHHFIYDNVPEWDKNIPSHVVSNFKQHSIGVIGLLAF